MNDEYISKYKQELRRVNKKKNSNFSKLVLYNVQKYVPLSLILTVSIYTGNFIYRTSSIDYYNVETTEDINGNKTSYEQLLDFSNTGSKLIHYGKYYEENGKYKRNIDTYYINRDKYEQFKKDYENGNVSASFLEKPDKKAFTISDIKEDNDDYYKYVSYSEDLDNPIKKSFSIDMINKYAILLVLGGTSFILYVAGPFAKANKKIKEIKENNKKIDLSFLKKKLEKTK